MLLNNITQESEDDQSTVEITNSVNGLFSEHYENDTSHAYFTHDFALSKHNGINFQKPEVVFVFH